MKRKVVKQGSATLTVSLPTSWTKKYNIKPGDEIEMEVQDKAILIT
ncbi:AbrB/MazE/SpoVT family DNA-binding domain-containing protein, partial [Candidatus Woesearchaeota archaeon]|nr:AbrB/MazE/SpoVT family DNA-binding domain-containing protein [Candidatus Woesearchaeota archaeon]